MATNSVVVITLSSSDEDSNKNVEIASSTQNDVKPKKLTARKSTHTKASVTSTAKKDEPLPQVSQPSSSKMGKSTINVQIKSTNSAEPSAGPSPEKKTARKSFQNSNSERAPKVVSILKNSSKPQCAIVTTSQKQPLSNAAIVAVAKLPGLTITPLSSSSANVKALPTARKSCSSQPLPKSTGSSERYFKPSATSTPKFSAEANKSEAVRANKNTSPLIPPASTNSPSMVSASFSVSKLAKHLPGVSIHPLSKTGADSNKSGKTTKTAAKDVPSSLRDTLGKTGVTITNTTGAAVSGKIPETRTAVISSKDKKEIPTVNAGRTNVNSSNNLSPLNTFTFSGNKTSSLIKLLAKDDKKLTVVKENSGVGSIAVKPGISITSIGNGQANEQSKLLNTNKHERNVKDAPKPSLESAGAKRSLNEEVNKKSTIEIKIKRIDKILSSLNAGKPVNESKRNSNLTLNSKLSKIKTTLNDPLAALRSNNAVTVEPVSVNEYVQSMYEVRPEKALPKVDLSKKSDAFSVKVVISQSNNDSSKKRALLNDDAIEESASKKAKLDIEPKLNGSCVNLATAEVNMKRIAALKESLKKIAAETSKKVNARKECSEPSSSQHKGSGKICPEPFSFYHKSFRKICPKPSSSQHKDSGKIYPESSSSQHKDSGKICPEPSSSQHKGSGKIWPKPSRSQHKDPGKICPEPSSSQHKDLGKECPNSTGRRENKKIDTISEKLQSKSVNSAKGILNERPLKQVTSPKLSLKRRAAEMARVSQKSSGPAIPLPYITSEPPEKKAKPNSTPLSSIAIPLPYFPRELSKKKPEYSSTGLNAKLVPSSQNNASPDLSSHVQQKDTSSENPMPWNSSDNNVARFRKLMEFSKSFMSATPEEKCIIVKNFHKLLNKADPCFVNSAEFSSLMEDAVNKIKVSKDTFVHLQTIRTELKAYKKRRNSSIPAKLARHPSSSSELSEATASNLEPPQPNSPKEVPAPSLEDNLASALHTITSNFKRTESQIGHNNPFPSVPCSSKQADIVENLRFLMPVSNGIKLPSDLISTSKHADDIEELPMSVPASNDSPSTSGVIDKVPPVHLPNKATNPVHLSSKSENSVSLPSKLENSVSLPSKAANPVSLPSKAVNPVPLPNKATNSVHLPNKSENSVSLSSNAENPIHLPTKTTNPVHLSTNCNDAPLVIDLDTKEEQKDTLFATLNLQSIAHKSEDKVINGEHKVKNFPPIPNKKSDQPKPSESKSDKLEKRVKFLEAHLKKLDKKIKKLQSKELSLEDMDDEDSTYIMEDRYKKKFRKIWETLCKIKKRSSILLGREIDKRFTYEGSRHSAFNKAIEKLINKRKPLEKFPNFNEVYNLLKKINEESHLALDTSEILDAAREAFTDVGRELKRRRQCDDAQDFGCYLTDDITMETDPAEQDEELRETLTKSAEEGEKRLQALYAKYTAQQPKETSDDGSNCEEPAAEDSDGPAAGRIPAVKDEPMSSSMEDNPVAIEVTANLHENTNLPDTDPATPETDPAARDTDPASPETDAHEEEERVVAQPVARTDSADVIDIGDSCSSASTEPGSLATERRSSITVDVDTETRPSFIVDGNTEKRSRLTGDADTERRSRFIGEADTEGRSRFIGEADTERRSRFIGEADTERRSATSTFTVNTDSRILIDDIIEIEEDQPQNSDDSLPSLEELLKTSKVK